VTRLEVGYSARAGPDLRAAALRPPLASMPVEYLTPASEARAIEVQALLADRGQGGGLFTDPSESVTLTHSLIALNTETGRE
jgi:hypothetical protein